MITLAIMTPDIREGFIARIVSIRGIQPSALVSEVAISVRATDYFRAAVSDLTPIVLADEVSTARGLSEVGLALFAAAIGIAAGFIQTVIDIGTKQIGTEIETKRAAPATGMRHVARGTKTKRAARAATAIGKRRIREIVRTAGVNAM
jgi:hypothetical protein